MSELLAKGFLASLKYYDITKLDLSRVRTNSTGADYDEKVFCKSLNVWTYTKI